MRRVCLLAALIPLSWAPPSRAEPVLVRVTAVGPCADANELASALSARSSRVRIDARAANDVHLQTEATEGGARGTLVLSQAGAEPRTRTLEAPSCVELVNALAFVAAVALDPSATPPAPARPSSDPPDEALAPPAPAAAPSPPRAAPVAPARPTQTGSRTGAPRRVRFEGALHGLASARGVDGLAAGAGVDGGIAIGASARPASLRVGFDGETALLRAAPASGRATWIVGSAEACAPGWARGALSAAPCLAVGVGQLTVRPRDVDRGAASSRLWAELGAGARLTMRLGASPWVVELTPRAELPLTRDRFLVAGVGTLYRTPPLSGSATLAVGLSFL